MRTAYYTVEKEIVAESVNGVRFDYLTDALSSVTAKVDSSSSIASTARYMPYGQLLFGDSFVFGWVGSLGYRTTYNQSYVRARHYLKATGNWTVVDSLWPNEAAFVYVGGNCVLIVDPTGLQGSIGNTCAIGANLAKQCNSCCASQYPKDAILPDAYTVCFASGNAVIACGCVPPYLSVKYPKYRKCLQEHEDSHANDFLHGLVNCDLGSDGCGTIYAGSRTDQNSTECRAFIAELDCAISNFPNPCPGKTQDEQSACEAIRKACDTLFGQEPYPDPDDPPLDCGALITPKFRSYCASLR